MNYFETNTLCQKYQEELKSEDFIIKDLLQTVKETKKSLSQFNPLYHA